MTLMIAINKHLRLVGLHRPNPGARGSTEHLGGHTDRILHCFMKRVAKNLYTSFPLLFVLGG